MNRPDIKRLPKRGNPLDAQKRLLDAARKVKLQSEAVPLAEALGRVLAKDVFSDVNIPAYDKTFIDGYAINPQKTKDASVNAPAAFKVVGKLFPADYPTHHEGWAWGSGLRCLRSPHPKRRSFNREGGGNQAKRRPNSGSAPNQAWRRHHPAGRRRQEQAT